ncbi:MAG: 50S ribosomal protein L30 [Gemmatimonadetes bacterium]|jgi:large subunit ribosomal protein L30|nr:50S ribosomal protein L30 [Gemmatimonadota bacterium]MDQ3522174.1 50S ribosomal protein L30 [Gemmatimonadota bacterium]
MPSLHITQVKSGVGAPGTHRRTLVALGLKHQRSVVHQDTPAIRGMLFQIRHLVRVTETEGQGEKNG